MRAVSAGHTGNHCFCLSISEYLCHKGIAITSSNRTVGCHHLRGMDLCPALHVLGVQLCGPIYGSLHWRHASPTCDLFLVLIPRQVFGPPVRLS